MMNTSVQFVKKLRKMNGKAGWRDIVLLLMTLVSIFISPGNRFSDVMDNVDGVSFLNYVMLTCFFFYFMQSYISEKNNNPVNIKAGLYSIAKTGNLDLKQIFRYIYVKFLPYAVILAVVSILRGVLEHSVSGILFAGCAFVVPAILDGLFYFGYKYIAEHRRFGGIAIIMIPVCFLFMMAMLMAGMVVCLFGSLAMTAVADAVLDPAMREDVIMLKCYSVYAMNIAVVFSITATVVAICLTMVPKKWVMVIAGVTLLLFGTHTYLGATCYVHTELDRITVSHFGDKTEYAFSDIESVVVSGKEEIEIKAFMKDGSMVTILDDMTMTTDRFANTYKEMYSFAQDLLTEMDKADVWITVTDAADLLQDADDKDAREAMEFILQTAQSTSD